jgi:hypothetical protein
MRVAILAGFYMHPTKNSPQGKYSPFLSDRIDFGKTQCVEKCNTNPYGNIQNAAYRSGKLRDCERVTVDSQVMDILEEGATRKMALFGASLEQSKKGLKLISATEATT